MMDLSTARRLIELVKPHECLYNGKRNPKLLKAVWAQVQEELDDEEIDARSEWKHMKNNYSQSRYIRRILSNVLPYYLEEELAFLEKYLRRNKPRKNKTKISFQDNSISDSDDEIENAQEDSYEHHYNSNSTSERPVSKNLLNSIQMNSEMNLHYNTNTFRDTSLLKRQIIPNSRANSEIYLRYNPDVSGIEGFRDTSILQRQITPNLTPANTEMGLRYNSYASGIEGFIDMGLRYNSYASGIAGCRDTSHLQMQIIPNSTYANTEMGFRYNEYASIIAGFWDTSHLQRQIIPNSTRANTEMGLRYNPYGSITAGFRDTFHLQRKIIPNSTHANFNKYSCSPQKEPLDLTTSHTRRN